MGDRLIDAPTDTPSYRDARGHLKGLKGELRKSEGVGSGDGMSVAKEKMKVAKTLR